MPTSQWTLAPEATRTIPATDIGMLRRGGRDLAPVPPTGSGEAPTLAVLVDLGSDEVRPSTDSSETSA
jgi:hypothetical protein